MKFIRNFQPSNQAMTQIFRVSAFTVFLSISALIGFTQAPKYSNEFLAIGVGARALGMSGAFIAQSNDVTSGYWNPAGLSHIKNTFQIGLMHSEYFAGIAKYDYLGVGARINPESVLGVSIIRFGVDDIPNTTQLIDNNGQINYDRIKSFTAADYAFIISYARKTKVEGLDFGANAKIIYRKVGDFANAFGFGLDVGTQYQRGTWKFAVMGRDITSTFNAWSYNLDETTKEVFIRTGNEIPTNSLEITLPKLMLGAGKQITIYKKFTTYIEANFDFTFDGKRNVAIKGDPISIDPKFGIQLAYSDFIFVRGGVGNIQQVLDFNDKKVTTIQPNIGVGVRIKNFTIDYALANVGQSVGLLSNVFSLRFDFTKKEKAG